MNTFTVGYFVGSLAKASLNRLLSKALVRLAPQGLRMVEIPFRDLPLYSPDYEADYPAVAQALKDAIAAADAVCPGCARNSYCAAAPSRPEQFLHTYMNEFYGFIQRVYTVLPRNS